MLAHLALTAPTKIDIYQVFLYFSTSLAPQKACLCKTATSNCSSYSTYCCICTGEGNDKEGSVEATTFELFQFLLVTLGMP